MTSSNSSPPGGVGIQLVDAGDSRVVMVIPPGGSRGRGLGCFAVIWNAITIPMGVVMIFFAEDVNWEGGNAPPLWGLVLFFGLFWSVGIGVFVVWLRMRFTRILLSVEPEQLSIQRSLLGRKKLTVSALTENSYAELVTSYEENDVPVYCVCVHTSGGDQKFGTALSRAEKEWIVETINRALGYSLAQSGTTPRSSARFCLECGGELLNGDGKRVCVDCGSVLPIGAGAELADASRSDLNVAGSLASPPLKRLPDDAFTGDDSDAVIQERPSLAPYELSPESKVTIEFDSDNELVLSYRIDLPMPIKLFSGAFLTIFCIFWYSIVLTMLLSVLKNEGDLVVKLGVTAFLSIFILGGLMPLSILLAMFFGGARIQIDQANLTGSIGWWILRKKKRFPLSSLRDVGIGLALNGYKRNGRRQTPFQQAGAVLDAAEMKLPLTISSDSQFNREVAGLVRYQLERLGVQLERD